MDDTRTPGGRPAASENFAGCSGVVRRPSPLSSPTFRDRLPFQVRHDPESARKNPDDFNKSLEMLALTGARGLMIGRAAIRNPWIFQQIRQHRRGEPIFRPSGRDVLAYIHALYEAMDSPETREISQVQNMKKYLNYISQGMEPTGQFLHSIRRVMTKGDFFRICAEYLDHDAPVPHEPLPMAWPQAVLPAGKTDRKSVCGENRHKRHQGFFYPFVRQSVFSLYVGLVLENQNWLGVDPRHPALRQRFHRSRVGGTSFRRRFCSWRRWRALTGTSISPEKPFAAS